MMAARPLGLAQERASSHYSASSLPAHLASSRHAYAGNPFAALSTQRQLGGFGSKLAERHASCYERTVVRAAPQEPTRPEFVHPDSSKVLTKFVAETLLPTKYGKFRLRGYKHSVRLGRQAGSTCRRAYLWPER